MRIDRISKKLAFVSFDVAAFAFMMGLASVVASGNVQADDWPKQGLKIVVPFPVGGSNDLASELSSVGRTG